VILKTTLPCQMQMRSIQKMDALAKSLSTKQAEREVCNNLHTLGEKVFKMEAGARDACLFLQQKLWLPFH